MGVFRNVTETARGRELDDPLFGRLRYDDMGCWIARRRFAPLGVEVDFVLIAGQSGPDARHRAFHQELEQGYAALAEQIAPLLHQDMECFEEYLRTDHEDLELPRAEQVWGAFRLDGVEVTCPIDGSLAWHMVYTFKPTGDMWVVTLEDWRPTDVRLGESEERTLTALEVLIDNCDVLMPSPAKSRGSLPGLAGGMPTPSPHRNRWLRKLALVIYGLLGAAGCGVWLVVESGWRQGLGMVFGIVGFVFAVFAAVLGILGYAVDAKCRELQAGRGLLARWSLGADEWARISHAFWQRRRVEIIATAAVVCALGVVPALWVLVVNALAASQAAAPVDLNTIIRADDDQFAGFLAVGLGCGILITAASALFLLALGPCSGRAGEVLVGKQGVCVGDLWCRGLPEEIDKVTWVHGDPGKVIIRGLVFGGKGGPKRVTIEVPVPRGKENEVRQLRRDLLDRL